MVVYMRITKVAFAVTALLAASQVNAAGFQVSESSASGLGRAFAGEAAIGDDAASLARNPALMATFDKAQLSVVGSYVDPDVSIEGVKNPFGLASDLDAEDVAPAQAVPAMYYIQPLNDQFAAGLAIYSNYGTGTKYESDYVAGAAAGTTNIKSVNINPNLSFRVNEQLSFGAGVSLVYTTAELERNAGGLVYSGQKTNPTAPGFNPVKGAPFDTKIAKMEGDGYGFGWNVGALYEFNKDNRLGASYKAKVKSELEGDFTGLTSGNQKVDGTLDLNLPSILEVSGYHKLTNKFAISYSWMYTTWSDFESIVAESSGCSGGVCLEKEEDFTDSSRYAVGGEYYLSDAVTLRVGYAFDEQAGAATLSIPDTDRQWYTAGVTYKASDALSFDFGAALVAGKEITFNEEIMEGNPATSATFTSSGDAYIYSAQMNYSF
jgi:long-chain fatty acid transport protein